MKLTFGPRDSIYKIFKVLKKIPRGKQVDIFLDDHPLLEDSRWIEAFIKHIRELEVIASVTTKHQEMYEQLQKHGITAHYLGVTHRYDRRTKWFAKKLGRSTPVLPPIEYIKGKLALIAELAVLGLIVYLFRGTISPKAIITITPTTSIQPISYGFLFYDRNQPPELTVQPLSIVWYTGSIETSLSKTIDLQSVTTEMVPAAGMVRLFNTTNEEFSLLEKTTLTTAETNIPFTLDKWVHIPAGTKEHPGTVNVSITSNRYFEDGAPIGDEVNIVQGTKLYITKLPQSNDDHAIRAEPIHDFTNGEIIMSGTVVSTDIQRLEKQLLDEIKQQLAGIVRTYDKNDTRIHLNLPTETQIIVNRFVTNAQPGQSASFLQGTIDVTLIYPYIKKSDLKEQSQIYIDQRATTRVQKGGFSLERVDFYDPRQVATGAYIVPTTIQTFGMYDFTTDGYDIKTQLKDILAGKTKKEALSAALIFDEIHEVDIKISPFRYTSIPKALDKIIIEVKDAPKDQIANTLDETSTSISGSSLQ